MDLIIILAVGASILGFAVAAIALACLDADRAAIAGLVQEEIEKKKKEGFTHICKAISIPKVRKNDPDKNPAIRCYLFWKPGKGAVLTVTRGPDSDTDYFVESDKEEFRGWIATRDQIPFETWKPLI